MNTSPVTADAVVVAAGRSERMRGADKMSAVVCGRPLVAWTVEAMRAATHIRRVVLVVPADRVAPASSWVSEAEAEVVAGGRRRQESVAAGVARCDAPVILVQDGARPLATPRLADSVAAAAAEHGAAIPVVPVSDTVKRLTDRFVRGTVARGGLALAQTPQGVRRDVLLRAYARCDPLGPKTFTDEAALLEAVGVQVVAVDGERTNLKVTTPEDLAHAEALLGARLGPPRVGHGFDSHPFGPVDGLALGGITIATAPQLFGHSDGDAALHAIADALLGGAGLGDLGRLFPAGRAETRGARSGDLLRSVAAHTAAAGFRISSVDVTIVAGRPRLGAERLDAMRSAVAVLLGLEVTKVSVKASTANGSGPEGAGLAISASAVAVLLPTGYGA